MMYNNFYMPKQGLPSSNNFNFDALLVLRDELSLKLTDQLILNKQLMEKLSDPAMSQKTNSGSGSNGAEQKSNSKSLCEVKNEPEDIIELFGESPMSEVELNKSVKNDTKNIPKNYGKAILSFIKRSPLSRKLAAEMNVSYSDLMINIRRLKKRVNSIQTLRKMWGSENLDHKVKKCIRILSYIFMRKHCLPYIFHSKVRHYGTHIKYRKKLIEGIQNPVEFNHIKDY